MKRAEEFEPRAYLFILSSSFLLLSAHAVTLPLVTAGSSPTDIPLLCNLSLTII